MPEVFSSPQQLAQIANILSNYARLPFSGINIPGQILEGTLGYVRDAHVLRTYDFVDVIKPEKQCGWQVKSTLVSTPVTWKRAKIPDSIALVAESKKSREGAQALGDAIIAFCNASVLASIVKYNLEEIGYSRLVVFPTGKAIYFERLLCSRDAPVLFKPSDFEWHWSKPKATRKKEQLPALHGIHRESGLKYWAWHGLGENQLHFSGERSWWPDESDDHVVTFELPTAEDRLNFEKLAELLANLDEPT